MASVHEIAVGSYELTPASVWGAVAGTEIDDALLEWPPDLFALSDLVLQRSEAHRFALSPPSGESWPPDRFGDWASAVADAGRRWSTWVEDHDEPIPELLAEEWEVFRAAAEMPLTCLSEAQDWRVCEAILSLHAIADEACAALGVSLTACEGYGALYRARGRELLARNGSLSRVPVSPAGADEGSHRPQRDLVTHAIALRRCPSARGGHALEQGRGTASQHRASAGTDDVSAVAVAASGAPVGLSARPGLGPESHQGAIRLLRVCPLGVTRSRSGRAGAEHGPGRG